MKTLYTIFACLIALTGWAQAADASEDAKLEALLAQDTTKDLPAVSVRYYFYPNLDAYFDAYENMYIYKTREGWVKGPEIESGYRGYSLYNGTRYEITDYHGDQPQLQLAEHQKKFPKKYTSRRTPPKKDFGKEPKLALN
jgi:hypothetical protein